MEPIEKEKVQTLIDFICKSSSYLHLETTNGAYASHFDEFFFFGSAIFATLSLRMSMEKSPETDLIVSV